MRLLSALAFVAIAAAQCTKTFENSTFDLTPLRKSNGGAYQVRDDRGNHNTTVDPVSPSYDSYLYQFNVCNDVNLQSILSPEVKKHCASTQGAGGVVRSDPAAAFQYSPFPEVQDKYRCYRLSGDVNTHPGNETWSLIEPANPSRGVQVTYEGGDLCCADNTESCTNPVPRSLSLQFYCTDNTANSFDDETVLEYDNCRYRIWLESSFGCPTECSITDGHLCNNHGICDFDTTMKKPRCFCNNGWEGPGCAVQTPPPQTGLTLAGVVVIVVSIMLVGLLFVLYYLWGRIRGLRLDPNAYKSLTGGPEAEPGDIYDD